MSIEILQVVNSVARETDLPAEEIMKALEESLRLAARRQFGYDHPIKVEINRKSGNIKVYQDIMVVEDDYEPLEPSEENEGENAVDNNPQMLNFIPLQEIVHRYPDAKVGDLISEQLPPLDLSRVIAQIVKQTLSTKVREMELEHRYKEFSSKIGEIISGVVEKVEPNGYVIKIGSTEAFLPTTHAIKGDNFKIGDRVRAYLMELKKNYYGPQLIISRAHHGFLKRLMTQEVIEIHDGIVEIKAVARDPGLRAKVAVYSTDATVDAVGSCVGPRGLRIQAVSAELGGEKIDIMQWSSDIATLVVNAMAPAEVNKVLIDEDRKRIEVVVPDDQLSIAIGKNGQNVRLASEIIGWRLDVMMGTEESKRRIEDFNTNVNKLMESLDLDEMLAQLLASEGYESPYDIADSSLEKFLTIEGLEEDLVTELLRRANEYVLLNRQAKVRPSKITSIQDLVDEEIAIKLYNLNIKTLQDLADLASDEFIELIPDSGLESQEVDKIIMDARQIVYFSNKSNKKYEKNQSSN